ncbi:unnamed protein product [Arctogadus glacialis]
MDGLSKAGTFYSEVLSEEERRRLRQNLAGALKGAQVFIQERMSTLRNPHTSVNIVYPVECPQDYLVWSIWSLVYSNPCCLGLVALYYSVMVGLCFVTRQET